MKWNITLRERLKELGYRSYRDYLKSEHWIDLRKRYLKYHRLCFCGTSKVELHHRTYERLGQERFKDLVALCRQHHQWLHHRIRKHWAIEWEEDLPIDCLQETTEEYMQEALRSFLHRPF